MNETTRIHIAKISYDIEIAAKKQLEKYLRKLEVYADNQDWFDDIEIRVTEILADCGVQANGVISSDDVAAVQDRLGSPEDFLNEGDIAVGREYYEEDSRRLYRNTDNAVLGGVLSGIASYINVNPLWTRVAFIILLGISFGTVIILYLVLWLALPPARTAAEKLQLSGRPVTLASMKELHEAESDKDGSKSIAPLIQNILIYSLATISAISALGAFMLTAWISIGINIGVSSLILGESIPNTWEMWTAFVLCVVSGLLLSALFSVMSYALFKKKLIKRLGIAIVAIILSGLVTFSSAVGIAMYGSWNHYSQIDTSSFTKNVTLPDQFSQVKSLIVDTTADSINHGASMRVEYIVDADSPRYELTSNAASPKIAPKFSYSEAGDAVTITVSGTSASLTDMFFADPSIKIYGPALDSIKASTGSLVYKNDQSQASINIEGDNQGYLELFGSYATATSTSKDFSTTILSNASVEKLIINHHQGGIMAGVVKEVEINQAESCPVLYDEVVGAINISAVSSGKLVYNGQQRVAKTIKGPCGDVIIGDADEDYDGYDFGRG